jgi:hypothetical protein
MAVRVVPILTLAGVLVASAAFRSRSPSASAAHPGAAVRADSLEQQLTAAERQSWVAWQQRDGKYFQNFLSDDHVEVGTTGIVNKAQVVAFVGSPACVVTSYSVDQFHLTRFDENTALLTYRAEQNTVCGKARAPSPAWVSSLFVRRNGHWVNALYQQTRAE